MRDRETEQGLPGSKVPLCPHFFSFLINLFLAVLGLHCCRQALSSCGERGYSLLWYTDFLLWWLLLLQSMGSRAWAQ